MSDLNYNDIRNEWEGAIIFLLFHTSLNASYFRLILAKWKGYRFYLKYLISMALKTEDISSFVS